MRVTWSLFPKSYARLNPPELAHLLAITGLETTNAIVREGYHVTPANLADELPPFIEAMREEGVEVTRASTSYSAEQLAGPDSPLPIFRDCGIREFRMGWFPREAHNVLPALRHAHDQMRSVAEACEKYGVKAIYQLHHRTLITNPTSAFLVVEGLNPTWVGVELDPGNQSFEGYEPWDYACGLLREYVAWLGVKDTRVWQETPRSEEPGKGWRREFCPTNEGVNNWLDIVVALANIRFEGTFVMMPFYDERDEVMRTSKLRAEVDYVRALVEFASR